jgi:ubiquinone/menaquinone biosynthesis C-methylase UbiE
MVRTARQRHPDLQFTVGSIDALDVADGSLAGVLAWYSVVHTPPGELGTVIGELFRVLAPGGWLLLAFLSGDGALHLTRAHGCLSPRYVAQFRHAIWHPWER